MVAVRHLGFGIMS